VKQILVYRDEGVGPVALGALLAALRQEGVGPLRFADRRLLRRTSWLQETQALIMPGGRDLPYHDALQGAGNRNIAEFVRRGGNFLGLCAGAYYGCAAIAFEPGGPLEVIAQRELRFFPGRACGPVYSLGKFRFN
jgi:biotin--protein ligase